VFVFALPLNNHTPVHGDYLVVEAVEARLPLLDDLRLELACAVAGYIYLNLTALAFDGFREGAIGCLRL
jgi:hypothetical protein